MSKKTVTIEEQLEFIWDNDKEYRNYTRAKQMSNGDMLKQFHETYLAKRNRKWAEEPELEELASKSKWIAAHKYNKKTVHLGVYDTEIEAAKAYDDAVRDLHGEYAVLNLEKDYG